jgi:WD40 repeat protein
VEVRGERPEASGPRTHHVVVAGADDKHAAAMLDSAGGVENLLVLRRRDGAPLARRRAVKVVEESADLYETFERVAGLIGLNVHAEVFISYSRKDSDAADALTAALIGQGRRPWVDRRELHPSEEWLKALRQGIEDCDSFLFLASRASVSSEYCQQELGWADEAGKRIIPVVLPGLTAADLPTALASRQAIFAAGDVASPETVGQVVAALDRDARLVRLHQQFLGRALKWRRSGGDGTLLLRGSELAEAEDWLGAASVRAEPRPTELQVDFINASRAAARSTRRKVWLVGAAVVLVTSGLAVWATFSAVRARREADNAKRSQAEQHAFGAFVDWDADPIKAYLQADRAARTVPDSDALRETFEAMARNLAPRMPSSTTNLETGATQAAFSADLSRVVVRSAGQPPRVVPLTGSEGARVELAEDVAFPQYQQFKFSGDGALVAGVVRPSMDKSAPFQLKVWDAASGRLAASFALGFAGADRRPEVVGFTPGNESVFIETFAQEGGYEGHVLAVKGSPGVAVGEPWKSEQKFMLGRLDATLASLAQVRQDGARWLVRVVNPSTGAPLGAELPFAERVRQVSLSRDGRALAVVTRQAEEGGTSHVTAWVLEEGGPRQVGQVLTAEGPVFVWDVTGDGGALLVINKGADYPAELWRPEAGERVSVPVSRDIASEFVMKAGEEYKVLSFAGDGRYVLAREPLGDRAQGGGAPARQQLSLFDRETLRLVAAPFKLPLDYSAMRPAPDGTGFATASYDGLVERWELLRLRAPEPRSLPVAGPLLEAAFLPDGETVLTTTRRREAAGYSALVDLWHVGRGEHLWQLPEGFGTRMKFCLNGAGTLLATASPAGEEGGAYRVSLWDLGGRRRLWQTDYAAPVEALAFRDGDKVVSTAGTSEGRPAVVVNFDAASGRGEALSPPPALEEGVVHLAFSSDGEHLIADYAYSSVVVWGLRDNRRAAPPLAFSDAAGLRFELGYDILLNLRAIRGEGDGSLRGEVAGRVPVVVRRVGSGTTIVAGDRGVPLLSALGRGDASLYPVRGGGLLSPSGRWFALGTNTTTVSNASAVRVYDLASGFPVTDLLIHQITSRPGEPWPRLLSSASMEFDPVLALAYREEEGALLTLTANGVLRRWPFRRGAGDRPVWETPAELSAALTGRRFVSSSYVQRIPQAEYAAIREGLRAPAAEFAGAR